MANKVTKDKADADLERVADKLGKPPTIAEYQEHGQYSVPTVAKFYDGSFVQARETLGLSDGRLASIMRSDLLADIRRVAEIVGGEPSKDDYHEHGEYALSTITYRFDSWVAAKQEAGVYEGEYEGPGREELIEDMQRVDEEADGPLTQRLYYENGKWYPGHVKRVFPSWEAGCQAADVGRPVMGPKDIPDSAVVVDIQRVKDRLGYYPTKAQYNEMGEYTEGIAKVRFGSWMDALRAAGYDGNPQDGQRNPNWKDEPKYEHYTHPNWKRNRPRALERDDYTCQAPDCDIDREQHLQKYNADLTVHHIRRDDWPGNRADFHRLENLITFCINHHGQYEKRPADCEALLKK